MVSESIARDAKVHRGQLVFGGHGDDVLPQGFPILTASATGTYCRTGVLVIGRLVEP